jgi:hypothetical protein
MQPHRRQANRNRLTLLAGLVALAGCDRAAPSAPPVQAQAAAPTPAAPPPKPTYTLIITWMYGSQPPQTTQAVFHDQTACDQARDAAIAEGRRLALESIGDATPTVARPPAPATRRYIGSAVLPADDAAASPAPASAPSSTPPKVAAICAATSTP